MAVANIECLVRDSFHSHWLGLCMVLVSSNCSQKWPRQSWTKYFRNMVQLSRNG
ncbi:hypothetical protein GQ55_4G086400 [Panicum hallii var. hallii]|uniref:Uncharacterized protein n=1 Tax=Panicum hallii var. hallii TaxID=1504633 RepID=A0A2T7DWM6_9POAL|nr:hypothetical protein GQ55_4G086400 [Panicum hallii var. hallii]